MEPNEKLVTETRIAEYSPTAADREKARKEAEKAKQAAAEAKAAHLRSIGLQEAVQAALQWFEDNEIVEMAEQMRAALDNAKKESMA